MKRCQAMIWAFAVLLAFAGPVRAVSPMTQISPPSGGNAQDKQAAIKAMGPWLQKLDAGEYADAWTASCQTFKQKTPVAQWVETMKAIRTPYGPCLRRSVLTSIGQPVAPVRGGTIQASGYFVLAQFDSYFQQRKHAIENVCFERELDGTWHMAGYSLQPR